MTTDTPKPPRADGFPYPDPGAPGNFAAPIPGRPDFAMNLEPATATGAAAGMGEDPLMHAARQVVGIWHNVDPGTYTDPRMAMLAGAITALRHVLDGTPTRAQRVELMAAAICRTMREDLGKLHDWPREPPKFQEAFRRAAHAAELDRAPPLRFTDNGEVVKP